MLEIAIIGEQSQEFSLSEESDFHLAPSSNGWEKEKEVISEQTYTWHGDVILTIGVDWIDDGGKENELVIVDPFVDLEECIGREEEMKELEDYLLSNGGSRKQVFIHGAPGMGKTLLSQHLLRKMHQSHSYAIFFIHASSEKTMKREFCSYLSDYSDESSPQDLEILIHKALGLMNQKAMKSKKVIILLDDLTSNGSQYLLKLLPKLGMKKK